MPTRTLTAARLLPLAFLLAATTVSVAPAGAQEEEPGASEPFGGTFLLQPAEGADMEEVVDEGVSLVKGWLKRQFARGRIRETNTPYEWIQIFPLDGEVRISTPEWSLDIPLDGVLQWERADDDPVDVAIEWTGEEWVHRFEATDGVRVNRYFLGPDGERLTVDVTLTSDQLKGPLEYELIYRRR